MSLPLPLTLTPAAVAFMCAAGSQRICSGALLARVFTLLDPFCVLSFWETSSSVFSLPGDSSVHHLASSFYECPQARKVSKPPPPPPCSNTSSLYQECRSSRSSTRGRIQRKTLGNWDPMPELTVTSPYVHTPESTPITFTMGNPMP